MAKIVLKQQSSATIQSPGESEVAVFYDTDGFFKYKKPSGSIITLGENPIKSVSRASSNLAIQQYHANSIIETIAPLTIQLTPAPLIGTYVEIVNLNDDGFLVDFDPTLGANLVSFSNPRLVRKYDRAILYKSTTTDWVLTVETRRSNFAKPEYREITAAEYAAKQLLLVDEPLVPDNTIFDFVNGGAAVYNEDFIVEGSLLKWDGRGLESIISEGDKIRVVYV